MYRIRHAAKLAGINPTLLRAWERRYGLVEPTRTASGYRVYSSEDIELLQAAARLVGAGHSISEISRLPRPELLRVAAELAPPAGGSGEDEPAHDVGDLEAPLAEALAAVAAFDRTRLESVLFPLTTSTGLSPAATCERVLLPLLERIGEAWERGELTVAAEHFGSALVRARILQYLEFLARGATGPRVVCACPENEMHEGGLLAFAVHAAASRWQVLYLGAHTPLEQVLGTAERIDAAMVALSLVGPRRAPEIQVLLDKVAAARQAQPRLRVVMGGRTALAHRQTLERGGVEVAATIGIELFPV